MISETDIEQFAEVIRVQEEGIECRCCCDKFIPLDSSDFFCKKCLRNLHNELMVAVDKRLSEIEESEYRVKDLREILTRHRDIHKPHKRCGGHP